VNPSLAVTSLLRAYPRLYFACHVRHVMDPERKRLLSAHRAEILDHLDAIHAERLTNLARHMGVSASTMSLTICRLVRDGYVSSSRDRRDRRVVRLRLTAAGDRIRSHQEVLDPSRLRDLVSRLSPEDLHAGVRGIELLATAADAMMRSQSERRAWHRRPTQGRKR